MRLLLLCLVAWMIFVVDASQLTQHTQNDTCIPTTYMKPCWSIDLRRWLLRNGMQPEWFDWSRPYDVPTWVWPLVESETFSREFMWMQPEPYPCEDSTWFEYIDIVHARKPPLARFSILINPHNSDRSTTQ